MGIRVMMMDDEDDARDIVFYYKYTFKYFI
jgi:hypothetical protein